MSVDPNELLSLPAAEQLRLVELLWDNLGKSTDPIPLPEWVEAEALRRRNEMIVNPELGSNHDAVWSKINRRNE
jgi:putative addiction module component (TIGR02574 family)